LIINIPSPDQFIISGKNLLGRSWGRISDLHDFFEYNDMKNAFYCKSRISEEDFWLKCKEDVAECISISQHGAELIIKGFISNHNPLLILKNANEILKGNKASPVDFRRIKSIDAGDLIKTHNSVCLRQLSGKFKARFESARCMRNQFIHSVVGEGLSSVKEALEYNLFLHSEFFPGESWIEERHSQINSDGYCIMGVDDDVSGKLRKEVLSAIKILSPSVSKKYLGFNRKSRFLPCPDCSHFNAHYYTAVECGAGVYICYGCSQVLEPRIERSKHLISTFDLSHEESALIGKTDGQLIRFGTFTKKSLRNREVMEWPSGTIHDGYLKLI
jgi:hypothetical protein